MRFTLGIRGGFLLGGLVCLCLATTGCGLANMIWGKDGRYLLNGSDVLAVPGHPVAVTVRLQGGDFLLDKPGVAVRFARDGKVVADVVTDDEGYATICFTPPAPGDYVFTASVVPEALSPAPPPAEILVSCRPAAAPLLFIDLDKTIVDAGFKQVLVGNPEPMRLSQDVLGRLAADYTVVYLTYRLDYLGPKTKAWLAEKAYPRGPVLMADFREVVGGTSGAYKSEVLQDLRLWFTGRAFGVGDKISDVQAYAAHDIEPLLLLRIDEPADAAGLKKKAASLQPLPDSVQVVADWSQIESAVAGRATYPCRAVQRQWREKAAALRAN
jgi:hypothetical protein